MDALKQIREQKLNELNSLISHANFVKQELETKLGILENEIEALNEAIGEEEEEEFKDG